jgi:hypothetical protein
MNRQKIPQTTCVDLRPATIRTILKVLPSIFILIEPKQETVFDIAQG